MKRNTVLTLLSLAAMWAMAFAGPAMLAGCGRNRLALPLDVSQLPQAPKLTPPAAKAPPKASTIAEQLDWHTDWIAWAATAVKLDPKALSDDKIETILEHAEAVQCLGKTVTAEESEHVKQLEIIRTSDDVSLRRIWLWVVGISALLVLGGSVVGWVVSPKIGGGLALSGLTACIAAYLMLQYAWIVGVIGLAVVGIAAALLVRELVRSKAAFADLVKSFEFVKEASFKDVKSTVSLIQRPETQEAVAEVKEALGLDKPKE